MLSNRGTWHQRIPETQHYKWFENLVELHELTHRWLKEIQLERPDYLMTRGIDSKAAENLWMLESLSERKLEDFLDDVTPDEMLAKLEHAVWAVQSWTLVHFMGLNQAPANKNPIPDAHTAAIFSLLEQLCWKAGRACAEKRWSKLLPRESPTGDSAPLLPLSELIQALQDSPVSGYPHRQTFLIRRAVPKQIEVELIHCPHHTPFHTIKVAAGPLCELHWNFLRGFAYALDYRVESQYTQLNPRCVERWWLPEN